MDREQVRELLEAVREYVTAAGLQEFGTEARVAAEDAAVDRAVAALSGSSRAEHLRPQD